jgi:hypothetical protein
MPPSRIRRVIASAVGRVDRNAARSAAVILVSAIAIGLTLAFVNRIRPIEGWLVVVVGVIVGWQLLLNLAWLGLGLTVTWRLFPDRLPLTERICISVAVGVVGFVLGLYGLGGLGLFRPAFAVGLLLIALVAGIPGLQRLWREIHQQAPTELTPSMGRWVGSAATVFGILGVGVLYLGVFTPDAINYDARWIHLSIAQDYAREHHLLPFSGDWQRCYPHLASMLHTWDFLVPGLEQPASQWMMALHTEFALFLWTLVGVKAAVDWLVARPLRGAWAGYFLFPGVFVYDNNMGGAADHALAFFVLPLLILSVRLPSRTSNAAFILWGIVAGGAFLVKYQAVYVLFPLTLVVAWRMFRSERAFASTVRGLLRAASWSAAGFVGVTAPHFVKNVLFHRNPFYPLMQDLISSQPTVRDAALLVRHLLTDWHFKAPSQLGPRLKGAVTLLFTFAFTPHYSFTNELPTFGFLFTLTLPLLLFVPRSGRLWIGALTSLAALFCWAFTYLVDRNLQIVLPLFVATTVAILVRAWQLGRLARLGVAGLVLLQLVWGGDIWFGGSDRIASSINIIRSTLDGRSAVRFSGMSADYLALDTMLPKKAAILLHHGHPQLGINRNVHLDWAGFQGEIDYRNFKNARELYDRLRALGITHVVYVPGEQAGSSKQEDVVFQSLAISFARQRTRVGMFEVFPLPPDAPPARGPLQVLAIGLGTNQDGLYDVTDLGTCRFLPPEHQQWSQPRLRSDAAGMGPLLDLSDAVLVGDAGRPDAEITTRMAREFQAAAPYPGLSVFIRNPAR